MQKISLSAIWLTVRVPGLDNRRRQARGGCDLSIGAEMIVIDTVAKTCRLLGNYQKRDGWMKRGGEDSNRKIRDVRDRKLHDPLRRGGRCEEWF